MQAYDAFDLKCTSREVTAWGGLALLKRMGTSKSYNPKHHGRNSHHPLLAFVADWRLVANLWLRPGASHTANNALGFLEATLENLDNTRVGLFPADSGFYDKTIMTWLVSKRISHIISVKLTRAFQQAILD